MSPNQARHLKSLLDDVKRLLADKYIKGAMEHQSDLNKDYNASELLDMAIEEALDQITYLLTLKEVMNVRQK